MHMLSNPVNYYFNHMGILPQIRSKPNFINLVTMHKRGVNALL